MGVVEPIVIFLACLTLTSCSNVTVSPSSSCNQPCGSAVNGTTIDQALGGISSGDYLQIQPGCHCVQKFNLVGNVSDISLIGNGAGVQITCAPGLGLAFLNVTRLTLEGLTITGCGLNGSNAIALNNAINVLVDLFIQLADDISVAVVIASCTDVTVDHVTITNTTGIGLVGVNVAGQSNFTDNVFSFNKGQQCFRLSPNVDQSRSYTVGGGASFIYVDYLNQSTSGPVVLNIDNNTFSYNSYCGLETYVQISYQYFEAFRNLNYTVGSGGGLSLSLAQQGYTTNITVQRSSFVNNTATYGSAASIYWYAGLQDTHITFSDCSVIKNGLTQYQLAVEGSISDLTQGGIVFLKDLVIPLYRPSAGSQNATASGIPNYKTNSPNTLVFLGTKFVSNSGSIGSGVLISSQYSMIPRYSDLVVLDSCHFEGNNAIAGSALYIAENKYNGVQVGLLVDIQNCTFVNNKIDQSGIGSQSVVYAVVQASLMSVTIRNSSFLSNNGTALGGVASLITLEGTVTFSDNRALSGGAMALVLATIALVKRNSTISFIRNVATVNGGAIYADYAYGQLSTTPNNDCFLQFESIYISCSSPEYRCPDLTTANISMVFSNNTAKLGGMLYGSTLDVCPWAGPLKQQLNLNGTILEVMNLRRVIVHSDQSPNTPLELATPVSTLEIANTSSVLSYMPGQRFSLKILSKDRLMHEVPSLISALVPNIKVGDSGYWLLTQPLAGVTINGPENGSVDVVLVALESYAQSNAISISLIECPFGFRYSNSSQGDCLCSNATANSRVTCDPDLKLFSFTYGRWFGPSPMKDGAVFQDCLLDYCLPRNNSNLIVTVNPQTLDKQCADNRAGLLCGRCQDGYSAVFGTNNCMKCTNKTLGLLVFFAAAGIGIIAIISFLHISISEGCINGVLFYVSVVSTYEINFIGHFSARQVFIPIFWLNLDMGFETCFYDGMTPLARAGLGLVFPAYLFILMVLFIFLASRSLRLSEYLAKSNFTPSKLVATLIMLSYNSITQSCLQILGFIDVKVYQDDGSISVIRQWATDPNMSYLTSLHTVLFIIAIILVAVFVIPVPILLIIPTFTSRVVWRMKPLYDAFFCFYKDHCTFWLGSRLILRILIFIISSFLTPPLNVLLLGICIALVVFASSVVHPYKLPYQGALDSFFLTNILLLVTGSLYFQMLEVSSSLSTDKAEMIFIFIVVGVAYVAICAVFVWHMILRFPWLLNVLPCKSKFKGQHTSPFNDPQGYGTMGSNLHHNINGEPDGDRTEPMLKKPKFSQYREPLLDGDSVRLNDISTTS